MKEVLMNDLTFSNKATQLYWDEVKNFEPFSRQDEIFWFNIANIKCISARDRLIKANLRFVVFYARKYLNYGLTMEELISEGNMGLIKATENFDETKGYKFISYAVWTIKNFILTAIEDRRKIVRLTTNRKADIKKIDKLYHKTAQLLSKNPSFEEIAKKANMKGMKKFETYEASLEDVWIDSYENIDRESSILELFGVNHESNDLQKAVFDKINKEMLHKCLDILNEKEKKVIVYYFGLNNEAPMTLDKVGLTLNLTKERIRQIRNNALKKIKLQYAKLLK